MRELIEGLLAQTYGDFELVISDNASTDGTEDICRAYAAQDGRVKYARNATNIGAAANFNRVFELAAAPYFKWVAADDLYEPTYLEACFPKVRDEPSVSVSHCQTMLVDETGAALPYDPTLQMCVDGRNGRTWLLDRDECAVKGSRVARFADVLFQQIMCGPVYGIIPRKLLRKTVLNQSYFGSDKLLLAELAILGKFSIEPQKLFKKRMHAKMASVMESVTQQKNMDPTRTFHSLRLVKLKSYIDMLDAMDLTTGERVRCWAYLAGHSASALVPETLRYRPELAWRWFSR